MGCVRVGTIAGGELERVDASPLEGVGRGTCRLRTRWGHVDGVLADITPGGGVGRGTCRCHPRRGGVLVDVIPCGCMERGYV